jgi:hypothetical protein
MKNITNLAISCTSGGYKNAFTQGVLTAFEENSLIANVYAACSSSALIAAFAAFSKIRKLDLTLWKNGYSISQEDCGDQSRAMLHTIKQLSPEIIDNLWASSSSRLLITTSFVRTNEAIIATQSDSAKRLGQMLLLNALRHNPEWKNKNLEMKLFDTLPDLTTEQLTKENFNEVAYATTRMLHAWKRPAYINNQAYIDGSYTSHCPIQFLSKLKPQKIICICTEKDKIYSNIFGTEEIPSQMDNIHIDLIKPDFDLKDIGLDFYTITDDGLEKGYEHGYKKGLSYLNGI